MVRPAHDLPHLPDATIRVVRVSQEPTAHGVNEQVGLFEKQLPEKHFVTENDTSLNGVTLVVEELNGLGDRQLARNAIGELNVVGGPNAESQLRGNAPGKNRNGGAGVNDGFDDSAPRAGLGDRSAVRELLVSSIGNADMNSHFAHGFSFR